MTSGTTTFKSSRQWPVRVVATVDRNNASSLLDTLYPGTLLSAMTRLVHMSLCCPEHQIIALGKYLSSSVSLLQYLKLVIIARLQISVMKLHTEYASVVSVGILLIINNLVDLHGGSNSLTIGRSAIARLSWETRR